MSFAETLRGLPAVDPKKLPPTARPGAKKKRAARRSESETNKAVKWAKTAVKKRAKAKKRVQKRR